MIKIYSIVHLFVITAISFGNIDSIEISLFYPSYPYSPPYQSHRTTLFINNDNWTEYNIDISKFDHDSIAGIQFCLYHSGFDSLFLYIDSIILTGTNGIKIVEDFEAYNLGWMNNTPLPDRFWGAIMSPNGTVGLSDIIEDNSKCMKYGGCNFNGSVFGFIPILYFGQDDSIGGPDIDYQNWADYHTLSMIIKRKDYTTGIINKKQNKENNVFHVYQNQITKAVYINLPACNRAFNIFMYTVSGKLVNQYKNISTSNFVWRTKGLSKGVYLIKVSSGGNIFSNFLLLK